MDFSLPCQLLSLDPDPWMGCGSERQLNFDPTAKRGACRTCEEAVRHITFGDRVAGASHMLVSLF